MKHQQPDTKSKLLDFEAVKRPAICVVCRHLTGTLHAHAGVTKEPLLARQAGRFARWVLIPKNSVICWAHEIKEKVA